MTVRVKYPSLKCGGNANRRTVLAGDFVLTGPQKEFSGKFYLKECDKAAVFILKV